jgi:transcriptional regulator with XRE-family HTH domain
MLRLKLDRRVPGAHAGLQRLHVHHGRYPVTEDFGRRLRAASAYAGLTVDQVADALGMTPAALGRIEAGAEQLEGDERRALMGAVARVTGLPEAFFTISLAQLVGEEVPESIVDGLSRKIDEALAAMDLVVAEAQEQMTRGKDQLDRFISHQHEDRDLWRKIAEKVGVDE